MSKIKVTFDFLKEAVQERNIKDLKKYLETLSPEIVLKYLKGINDFDRSLLCWASAVEDNKIVIEFLLGKYAEIKEIKFAESGMPGKRGAVDAPRKYIEEYITLSDERGRTPLIYAIEHGCLNNIKLLVDKSDKVLSSVVSRGKKVFVSPLYSAIYSKASKEILEYLLDKGLDPQEEMSEFKNAVHAASRLGNILALRVFANKDIDLYRELALDVDSEGYTALHHAAYDKTSKAMKYLLYTEVNYRDAKTKGTSITPYKIAINNGNLNTANAVKTSKKAPPDKAFELLEDTESEDDASFDSTIKVLVEDFEKVKTTDTDELDDEIVYSSDSEGAGKGGEAFAARGAAGGAGAGGGKIKVGTINKKFIGISPSDFPDSLIEAIVEAKAGEASEGVGAAAGGGGAGGGKGSDIDIFSRFLVKYNEHKKLIRLMDGSPDIPDSSIDAISTRGKEGDVFKILAEFAHSHSRDPGMEGRSCRMIESDLKEFSEITGITKDYIDELG